MLFPFAILTVSFSFEAMMQCSLARGGPRSFFPGRRINSETPFRRIDYNNRKIGVQRSFLEGSRVVLRPQVQRMISNPKGALVSASCGRVLKGLSYAKEALNLCNKVLLKKFNVSSKKPVELEESSTTNGEMDHLCLELCGSSINEVWRDITNLE